MRLRPDVRIDGVDVLVRELAAIRVRKYDGKTIPFADKAFDFAMMIDVLHHTDNPANVLAEARRVSTSGIVLKDHLRDGLFAGPTLRFMDWVGNAPHGVRLPYNYLSRLEWLGMWRQLGLEATKLTDRVPLYPRPFSWIFGRKLHFTTLLKPTN
jgi:SAM-dependent methyltransferase